jgi:EmrB/QacA subfamily drug resistance transporter
VAELSGTSVLQRLLVERARPDRIRQWPKAPWLAVAAVCVGAFMGQLDASIVTLAIPSLRQDLHASLGAVMWVSLSYLLVLVGTVPVIGRLADIAGRKLLYTYGFAVFTLASLGCGLAPNLAALLAMRVVQAVGAAMLQANSVALIRTTVRADQLTRAIGLQGAAQALGLALGPALGGVLIGLAGWRWVFYVNVPAGLIGAVLGVLLLPRTRERAPRVRFDWAGVLTLMPACGALLLALSVLGRDAGLASVGAALSIALFAGFIAAERAAQGRGRAPLMDLALFRARPFAVGVAGGLLAYLVLFAVLFVSPLYLEGQFRMSSGVAGLMITVLPVCLALVAPLAGRVAELIGARAATAAGMATACAAFGIAAAGAGNRAVLVGMLALTGAGLGLFIPTNSAAVAGAGPARQAGMVGGLLNMTRGIGTSLGVAVAGATYALTAGTVTSAAEHGFRITMVALAVVAGSVAGLAFAAGAGVRSLPS